MIKHRLSNIRKIKYRMPTFFFPDFIYYFFKIYLPFIFWLFCAVEITVAAHDTTGGMETKIAEAAAIAKLGIDVYITKV